jgi:hypothetical protein
MQPVDDSQNPLNTVGKMAEILPCKVEQLVGIAVTRGQRIAQN